MQYRVYAIWYIWMYSWDEPFQLNRVINYSWKLVGYTKYLLHLWRVFGCLAYINTPLTPHRFCGQDYTLSSCKLLVLMISSWTDVIKSSFISSWKYLMLRFGLNAIIYYYCVDVIQSIFDLSCHHLVTSRQQFLAKQDNWF